MTSVVPHLKLLHALMLSLWCGGLFALPFMLARHDPAISRADYVRIRRSTHFGYTHFITPAPAGHVLLVAAAVAAVLLQGVFLAALRSRRLGSS